jgi:hypothetical protein
MLFHAVPFKTLPQQLHTVSSKTVPLLKVACTDILLSAGCGEYKEHGTTVMLIWAISSCTDKRVGRNIVMMKKLTILCHFSGPFAAHLPMDAI